MSYYTLIAFVELLTLLEYAMLSVIGVYYLASNVKTLVGRVLVFAGSITLIFLSFIVLFEPTLLPIWGVLKINYYLIEFPKSIIFAISFILPITGFCFMLISPKSVKYRRPFLAAVVGTLLLLIGIGIYSRFTNIR